MKKLLILALLAALAMGTKAADYTYLVFTLTDGTSKSITANNLNITFADGNLTATSGSESVTIALTTLSKMEFSNDNTTGIDTIEANVTLDEATEIYDINGRRMPSATTLSRGIYIIKSNGKTSKITVK